MKSVRGTQIATYIQKSTATRTFDVAVSKENRFIPKIVCRTQSAPAYARDGDDSYRDKRCWKIDQCHEGHSPDGCAIVNRVFREMHKIIVRFGRFLLMFQNQGVRKLP